MEMFRQMGPRDQVMGSPGSLLRQELRRLKAIPLSPPRIMASSPDTPDRSRPVYRHSAQVRGTIQTRRSLGEEDGYLQVIALQVVIWPTWDG